MILGTKEVQIIQWFVEPEATVEEFDKLCEVQSDKATTDITSRFAGVIKKLHYAPEEMAQVGQPLIDIDILGDDPKDVQQPVAVMAQGEASLMEEVNRETQGPLYALVNPDISSPLPTSSPPSTGRFSALATPAVRHMIKDLDVRIQDIQGTGKDGRIMKEDVQRYAKARDAGVAVPGEHTRPATSSQPDETVAALSANQIQMFKAMTRSLAIPHFMYADETDVTQLHALRTRLNTELASSNQVSTSSPTPTPPPAAHLTYLPFIIKAVSLALQRYPILNARLDTSTSPSQSPNLIFRRAHNIGIAMDTPRGLLVPVVRDVAALSLPAIAAEIARLHVLGQTGHLGISDLAGGTMTVSNIGSIGGTYTAPVVVEGQLAILGIGKVRRVPAFADATGQLQVVEKRVVNFSWSADHRVVDGATMARAGEMVRGFVERPESMLLHLR